MRLFPGHLQVAGIADMTEMLPRLGLLLAAGNAEIAAYNMAGMRLILLSAAGSADVVGMRLLLLGLLQTADTAEEPIAAGRRLLLLGKGWLLLGLLVVAMAVTMRFRGKMFVALV